MVISCFKPASDRIGLYEYVYKHYKGDKAALFCQTANPYSYDNLNNYYFRPGDLEIHTITTNKGIDSAIHTYPRRPLLVLFAKQDEADRFAK